MLIPFSIPPGVYRNGTEYQSAGRYYDTNLVRWFENTMRPIGGWAKKSYLSGGSTLFQQVTGKARGMFSWKTNTGVRYYVIGTSSKLYIGQSGRAALVDITPTTFTTGYDNTQTVSGYGGSTYGTGTYGTPRVDSNVVVDATTWSFDSFGEILVAVSSTDGRVLIWELNTANKATTITPSAGTVPTGNAGIIVTAERFLFCLGANSVPRRVAWSSQETYTNWNIAATTTAGDFDLTTNGRIMLAKNVRGQVLILTSNDAHTATYVGPPFIYGFDKVGSACGAISSNCCAAADTFAVWMSNDGFWTYDGYVKPLPCDVSDYVYKDINTSQLAKVVAIPNSKYFEIWWFYPSAGSTENDSYVVWNYKEGHWTIGKIARTTGIDKDVFPNPIFVGADGYVYDHETGFNYDSVVPYAESGPVEIGGGQNTVMVRQMIPDEKTQGDVQARFSTKFYPNATEFNYGPYSMANPTSVRFTGRQVAIKVEGVRATDWRVGNIRFDAVAGGER